MFGIVYLFLILASVSASQCEWNLAIRSLALLIPLNSGATFLAASPPPAGVLGHRPLRPALLRPSSSLGGSGGPALSVRCSAAFRLLRARGLVATTNPGRVPPLVGIVPSHPTWSSCAHERGNPRECRSRVDGGTEKVRQGASGHILSSKECFAAERTRRPAPRLRNPRGRFDCDLEKHAPPSTAKGGARLFQVQRSPTGASAGVISKRQSGLVLGRTWHPAVT